MLAITLLAKCIGGQESKGFSEPFVAWANGQEVEFRFHLAKIKSHDLTLKDLEIVKRMRFLGDDWKRTIKDTRVDLKSIAELKFRPLQASPFAVKLLDGREAVITPDAKKIVPYLVTGDYFQEEVVSQLRGILAESPEKTVVMQGIVVFGDLPHSTGPDKIHRSLGEPLGNFARVEIRGKPGPQAVELLRMQTVNRATMEAIRRLRGTSREWIEKRFGPGEPSDPKKPDAARKYSLSSGHIEVHWISDDNTVDYIYAVHGKSYPKASAKEPEKLAKEARDFADAQRAFLFAFFCKMRDSSGAAERLWIRELLDRTDEDLRWTAAERMRMLGDGK